MASLPEEVARRHGDGSLQLVQLGRAHGIKLLAADEGVLRQGQDVVLRHAVGVGLGIEILLQRGWKEIVEPGGLVRSLLTDEHEDDVVDHIIGDPRCHSRSGKCPSQKMDYPLRAALRAASEDRLQQVGEELHPHPGIVYFRLFGGTIRERNAGNREYP